MSVGAQTNQGNVNQNLTDLATEWRDLTTRTLQKWAYLNKLGVPGLQALGFTAGDAQAVLDSVNHLATPAQVYRGTATQASLFNFEDSLTPLWGGQ
jgi:hypothetical protein